MRKMRRGKSKSHVLLNLLIMHFMVKKSEQKEKIVVISDRILFVDCKDRRMQKRRGEKRRQVSGIR